MEQKQHQGKTHREKEASSSLSLKKHLDLEQVSAATQ